VYAEALVRGGVFAHCRNPLYLGNVLIVIGLALVIHAFAFYLIAIPALVFVYACVIARRRRTSARNSELSRLRSWRSLPSQAAGERG